MLKPKDDYYLMTPCCFSTDIMCYLRADFNSVRQHELEAERHFSWSHSDAFTEVHCNECGEEIALDKLVVTDNLLLDGE
jgi:hypothetical protein